MIRENNFKAVTKRKQKAGKSLLDQFASLGKDSRAKIDASLRKKRG